jgi:diadenosine tetraphosphate (Ap4A) HIT family hydrolase
MHCVFCDRLAAGDLTVETELAAAFADAFPLTRGHTLVVPRRHEADYFALTAAEQTAMWRLVNTVRSRIERELHPDGYNLGVNVGQAAGQTVGHAHIHLIPRYAGDVDDPRGGIRWIIPAKAPYWEQA